MGVPVRQIYDGSWYLRIRFAGLVGCAMILVSKSPKATLMNHIFSVMVMQC